MGLSQSNIHLRTYSRDSGLSIHYCRQPCPMFLHCRAHSLQECTGDGLGFAYGTVVIDGKLCSLQTVSSMCLAIPLALVLCMVSFMVYSMFVMLCIRLYCVKQFY